MEIGKSEGSQKTREAVGVESVIGPGLSVKGDIHSSGSLRVDGKVEGSITAEGSVVVGENGVVKADVTADHIVVGGDVKGKVIGREKVEIVSPGRMRGDIHTKPSQLLISEGVVFEGRCVMSDSPDQKE